MGQAPLWVLARCTGMLLTHLPIYSLLFAISNCHSLQVWALEMELITGISRVSDVRFPALARWGASRAWKKDILHVYIHRERLDSLSSDDVPVEQ